MIYYMEGGQAITGAPFSFDSARDAIDAVSRFEAATLEEWEYELRAHEDDTRGTMYRVGVNSLVRVNGRLIRGYLTPEEFAA